MKILNDNLNLEEFYRSLASSAKRLLMLDYDGTLAPFRMERDKALPYPEINDSLLRLFSAETTRVVIISGRSLANLLQLLKFDRLPEIWGCHGLERRTPDGQQVRSELDEHTRDILTELTLWIEQAELRAFSELKPSGAAFHWRGLASEQAESIREKVVKRWAPIAQQTNVELLDFDGGVELRVSATNKAVPVQQLIEESDSEAMRAYLGDDRTDEDAFKALKGHGLSVLVRDSLRETAADLWIQPPDELRDFLTRWI